MKAAISMLSIPADIPNFLEYQEKQLTRKIEETLILGIKEAIGDNFNPDDIVIQSETTAWGICRHVRHKGAYVGTLRAEPSFSEGCKWDISFTFRTPNEASGRSPVRKCGKID